MRMTRCGLVWAAQAMGVLALSACGSSSGTPSVAGMLSTVPVTAATAAVQCDTKLPRSAKDYVIAVDIPSDTDPGAANITPTTKIAYTVMLPERCPGEVS